MVEFSIMLTDEEKHALKAAAEAEGVTAEEFFRMNLRDFLDAAESTQAREGKLASLEKLGREVMEQRRRLDEMAAALKNLAHSTPPDAEPTSRTRAGGARRIRVNLDEPKSGVKRETQKKKA
jgi:hypothetical protein